MEGLGDFIKKISDGITSFADLLDKSDFKDQLGKAGTIGALINLGLEIYTKVKDDLRTDEELAFYSFYKVAFESAKESIPAEILITDVKGKNIKRELFLTFTKLDEWNSYLPDHPTIKKFRRLICDILRSAQDNNLIPKDNDLIPNFILKFDVTLEQKVDNDPDMQPFKKWYTVVEGTKNLRRHLQDSRLLFDRPNSIDQKKLKTYYVENNARLTDLETWDKKEENYYGEDREVTDLISDFLKEKGWYMVIGAPFGIGKTSLAIYLRLGHYLCLHF
jgi:hypothetical protein